VAIRTGNDGLRVIYACPSRNAAATATLWPAHPRAESRARFSVPGRGCAPLHRCVPSVPALK